jgi:3-oxoacyl-[acyl-carrier protein] reductase
MKKELKGRIALIGGASKGLGFGCAEALAKNGAHVILVSRDAESLKLAASKLQHYNVEVLTIAADMADKQANDKMVQQAIEKFGRIDILINNSGGPKAGKYDTLTDDEYEVAFQSVLMYTIRLIKAVVPSMKKQGWGRIINITSLSVKEPAETLVLSNVFRAGVVAFAKSISKELIQSHITINNVCPGAFKTDRAKELIQNAALAANKSPEEIEAENVKKIPLGRYQHPEELGSYVAYLCSSSASGITGTTLQIDGGISNGLF